MKDDFIIEPQKGKIDPKKHSIIKLKLIPKNTLSSFDGELEIKIVWTPPEERQVKEIERDNLFIRIIKKAQIRVILFIIYH